MKKIYLSMIALAIGTTSMAQNYDFEGAWAPLGYPNYDVPTDWNGTTKQEQPGANSTANALRCETVNDATLAGLAFSTLGLSITNNNVLGVGISSIGMTVSDPFPVSVDFYMQFTSVNNDTAGTVLVEIYDTLLAGNTDDVLLAQGIMVQTTDVASWTMVNVPLTYMGGGTPTNIDITVVSSPKDYFTNFPSPLPDPESGTILLVDEFVLVGNQASIEENVEVYEIKSFPNPATDNFTVVLPDSRTNTIDILALTGQKIKSVTVNNLNVNINVSDLDNGIYMYQLKDSNGKILTTKKLVIKK